MSEIDYPNREHANADNAARRRVRKAVTEIAYEADLLRRKLDGGAQDLCADDAQTIARSLQRLTENLAVLGILREVREWHEADRTGR